MSPTIPQRKESEMDATAYPYEKTEECQPDRPPGELERISELLGRLSKSIAVLEERLQPVLAPEGGSPSLAQQSPVAPGSQIVETRQTLERHIGWLADLTARIQL